VSDFPNLNISKNRDSFCTTYTVTGPPEEVSAWFATVKRNFHPAGYGTWGRWEGETFVVTHYNSCD
jgi:hypothetical protein